MWNPVSFGKKRFPIELPPEIRINLWFELLANHPRVLKMETPSVDIPHINVKAPENYHSPVSKETGKAFPDCCEFHKGILEEVEEWFRDFPNCCSDHQKLNEVPWFSSGRYSAVANKVARQVIFTEYQILKHIDSSNWNEEVTNYIEANVDSFGMLPRGYGYPIGLEHYLKYLKLALKDGRSCLKSSEIGKDKIERLEFFLNYCNPDLRVKNKILIDLCSIYRKWLNIFPFKTGYFRSISHYFENNFPIHEKVKYNPYLRMQIRPVRSNTGLEDYLVDLTKKLLKQINTQELIENGDIRNLNEHKLEINSERYRIKRAALLEEYSGKEIEYVKILKKWLKNEFEYSENIAPFLSVDHQSSDKWYNQAVSQGFKADILKEVSELFSVAEQPEVEKAVIRGLSRNQKYYEGYAEKISVKQFALCHHFLKEANIIHDDILNPNQYGNSFKSIAEQKNGSSGSWRQHKKAKYYVDELIKDKELNDHNIFNLEVVKRVFIYYPLVQKHIMEFTDSLKEKKVPHNAPPGRR